MCRSLLISNKYGCKAKNVFIYQNKNATFYQQALSFPFVIVKSLINR